MAGPGGGSHGGGFGGGSHGGGGFSGGSHGGGGFGGGSHGGGFGGGGFGGGPRPGGGFGGGPHGGPHPGGPHRPPHHHHHGPHWYGGFFGPRWHGGYGGGVGCLTTFVIIALFIAVVGAFMIIPDGDYVIGQEGVSQVGAAYDEATMQDYANTKYKKYFGSSEDNILLVFLANKEADGYYTIAWVGDNIDYDINAMFGEYTEYGDALGEHINDTYFAYSLDTDLAAVVSDMESSIKGLGLSSSFSGTKDDTTPESKFYNFTSFDLSESVVDAALESFTKSTGIPMAIVVDYVERVFGDDDSVDVSVSNVYGTGEVNGIVGGTANTGKNISLKIGIVAIAIVIFTIVLCVAIYFANKKAPKKKKDDDLPWES